MNTVYHIVDDPKPLSLDFDALKSEGLSYIQEHMDNSWTNLNPSDPGITILDQLCYALTELGYCNDFPIEDILTAPNGELHIKDQFYLPENILTTSPVTDEDFRKYISDAVAGIDNLLVLPVYDNAWKINGVYQLYLLINDGINEKTQIDNICKAAFFQANKARNLGELFLMPLPLAKARRLLQGKITIVNEQAITTVLSAIQQALDGYVFPKIISEGYNQLVEKNAEIADDIFNGPLLANGWIADSSLVEKKNKLRINELVQVIGSIAGVEGVTELRFTSPDASGSYHATSADISEILFIDVLGSVNPSATDTKNQGLLNIVCNGSQVPAEILPTVLLRPYAKAENNILYGAQVNVQTLLPKGKFRDINTYYSIQNTFPEIFRVGANAVVSNVSDFQIAQSRQLKGYLTLFDQVLANQFSQLAALGELFCFRNATTATPSDRHNFYAVKDADEIAHPKYPVPFRDFSPTYFYQSLYNVPDIRPLLKNNEVFDFGADADQDDITLVNDSWVRYQQDPYNAYMLGLKDFMEDPDENLKRRNEILNHLLARHGESPVMIDTLIHGAQYSGDTIKDKVIFKSIYLQNFDLLSYYRQKAHSFTGARRISAEMPEVKPGFEEKILGWDSTDFIINTEKIDRAEKLKHQDFIDYSAVELKLCLLFGLKILYKNFIANHFIAEDTNSDEIKMVMWLITQRRGFIFLETSLLNFYATPADKTNHETLPATNNNISSNEIILLFPSFIPILRSPGFLSKLDFFLQNETPVRLTCKYYFLDASQLMKIIPVYTDWHNCLVYQDPDHIFNKWLTRSATTLTDILNTIIQTKNESTK